MSTCLPLPYRRASPSYCAPSASTNLLRVDFLTNSAAVSANESESPALSPFAPSSSSPTNQFPPWMSASGRKSSTSWHSSNASSALPIFSSPTPCRSCVISPLGSPSCIAAKLLRLARRSRSPGILSTPTREAFLKPLQRLPSNLLRHSPVLLVIRRCPLVSEPDSQ